MPLPTAKQIAGIVWAECGGIRESQTQVTSARTYEHRLAIATVVVNRVRQNLNYNDGRGTARERYPSGSALQNPDVVEAWQETQLAAEDGLQTVRYILTSRETLEGAQFYCHVYHPWHSARWRGTISEAQSVANYPAWDPRRGQRRTVYLAVHVNRRIRDAVIRRTASAPASSTPR